MSGSFGLWFGILGGITAMWAVEKIFHFYINKKSQKNDTLSPNIRNYLAVGIKKRKFRYLISGLIAIIVIYWFIIPSRYMDINTDEINNMIAYYENQGLQSETPGDNTFLNLKSPTGFSLALQGKDPSKLESTVAFIPLNNEANIILTGALIRGVFHDDATVETVQHWVSENFQQNNTISTMQLLHIQDKYVSLLFEQGSVLMRISKEKPQ